MSRSSLIERRRGSVRLKKEERTRERGGRSRPPSSLLILVRVDFRNGLMVCLISQLIRCRDYGSELLGG